MRVMGIDPGLRNLGWGVIESRGSRLSHVANGVCKSGGGDLAARLLSLHQQLTDVLTAYQPDAAAVERADWGPRGAGEQHVVEHGQVGDQRELLKGRLDAHGVTTTAQPIKNTSPLRQSRRLGPLEARPAEIRHPQARNAGRQSAATPNAAPQNTRKRK